MSERVKTGRLELGIDLPPELPMLLGDELRLKQIVLNLLSNAIKFTPAGGRVTLSAADFAGGWPGALAVADTGIGMKPEEIPIALEPFRQIDSVHTGASKAPGSACRWRARWPSCMAARCTSSARRAAAPRSP